MKKIINTIMILILILSNLTISMAQENPDNYPLSSGAAVVIDYETGEILYGRNEHGKMFPASTTKMMTAILAYENLQMDEVIKIDYDFGYVDGSSMYILQGEEFTVEQLLKTMLIKSANDAAVILGNKISGSPEEFAKLMNKRAKELGAKDTHFANPNGLHDDNHYTTAYDLALIGRKLISYDYLKEIVGTVNYSLDETPLTPEKRYYRNTNHFLWSQRQIAYKNQYIPIKYDLVDGIKTGYTNKAGNCLVSTAKNDDIRVVSVTLKSNGFEVYSDSRYLLDYGLENFKDFNILQQGEILGNVDIPFSKEKSIEYESSQSFTLARKKDFDSESINRSIKLNDELKTPIKKGNVIGRLELTEGDDLLESIDIIASSDANFIIDFEKIKSNTIYALKIISIVIVSLILICLSIRFYNIRKRKSRSLMKKRSKNKQTDSNRKSS